jgi:hypothetical protein
MPFYFRCFSYFYLLNTSLAATYLLVGVGRAVLKIFLGQEDWVLCPHPKREKAEPAKQGP